MPIYDLTANGFGFSSTSVTFEPLTAEGESYLEDIAGPGACGVTVLKSYAGDYLAKCERDGLKVKVIYD
jgi:hypothetical protein